MSIRSLARCRSSCRAFICFSDADVVGEVAILTQCWCQQWWVEQGGSITISACISACTSACSGVCANAFISACSQDELSETNYMYIGWDSQGQKGGFFVDLFFDLGLVQPSSEHPMVQHLWPGVVAGRTHGGTGGSGSGAAGESSGSSDVHVFYGSLRDCPPAQHMVQPLAAWFLEFWDKSQQQLMARSGTSSEGGLQWTWARSETAADQISAARQLF